MRESKQTITKDKLYHSTFDDKPVPARPKLRGGMALNTPDLPVVAAGRQSTETPRLSYAMAMAALKLVSGEISDSKFIGNDGDTTPLGAQITSNEKKFTIWSVLRKGTDGMNSNLELRGRTFGTGMVSYYAGLAFGAFMMLNHSSYPNFVKSVREAIEAENGTDETKKIHAIAKMSDEITYAVEQMLDGKDPMGISTVTLLHSDQIDLTGEFKGGEALKEAFVSTSGLDKMLKTKVKAVTYETVLTGDVPLSTSFVGDLPVKTRDLVMRGKHFLLTGPTATGKTHCVREVAHLIGAPLTYIISSDGIEDQDLIGSMVPDGEGSWRFTDGPLIEAFRNGKTQADKWQAELQLAKSENRDPVPVPPAILLIDEVNRLQSRFQNIFVSAMNVRPFTDDHYFRVPQTNEELTCPVGFLVFVAARNFGCSYVGTNPMDLAFERRFHKKIDVNYLEPKAEIDLVAKRTGLNMKACKALVKSANDSRSQLTQLRAPIDTDTLLKWAEELAYIEGKGVRLTDKVVLDMAKEIVFDVVLERTDRGGFEPSGESIMSDNISESWKEVFKN